MRLVALMLMMVALTGCFAADDPPEPTMPVTQPEDPAPNVTVNATPPSPPRGLRFIAVGDQGTGYEEQFQVARAMRQVCDERGCDFAMGLGDNIYEYGVSDENDPQFDSKFEQPYAAFRNLTWYMVQGNHDNSYDPVTAQDPIAAYMQSGIGHWYESGNHEVAYHYRTDRPSQMWYMPDRYYAVELADDDTNTSVSILALDTNLLMYWGFGASPDMPTMGDQEAWFQEAAAAAQGTWKLVIGHHPYISNGEHGNAGDYDQYTPDPGDPYPNPNPVAGPYVEQFYEEQVCGWAHLILTGHDHDLQWLRPPAECGVLAQLVSGAGAKSRSVGDAERNEAVFQRYDTNGLLWGEFLDNQLRLEFYDADANMLAMGDIYLGG